MLTGTQVKLQNATFSSRNELIQCFPWTGDHWKEWCWNKTLLVGQKVVDVMEDNQTGKKTKQVWLSFCDYVSEQSELYSWGLINKACLHTKWGRRTASVTFYGKFGIYRYLYSVCNFKHTKRVSYLHFGYSRYRKRSRWDVNILHFQNFRSSLHPNPYTQTHNRGLRIEIRIWIVFNNYITVYSYVYL